MILTFWAIVDGFSKKAFSKHAVVESRYAHSWCLEHSGTSEVVFDDKTRCDCVTETNAIEFDFAPKFAESIGQSLMYAIHTNKRAGIVLIIEKPEDSYFFERLQQIIEYHKLPIDIWRIDVK